MKLCRKKSHFSSLSDKQRRINEENKENRKKASRFSSHPKIQPRQNNNNNKKKDKIEKINLTFPHFHIHNEDKTSKLNKRIEGKKSHLSAISEIQAR